MLQNFDCHHVLKDIFMKIFIFSLLHRYGFGSFWSIGTGVSKGINSGLYVHTSIVDILMIVRVIREMAGLLKCMKHTWFWPHSGNHEWNYGSYPELISILSFCQFSAYSVNCWLLLMADKYDSNPVPTECPHPT